MKYERAIEKAVAKAKKILPCVRGRSARCLWCGEVADSSWSLVAFRHSPSWEEDEFLHLDCAESERIDRNCRG